MKKELKSDTSCINCGRKIVCISLNTGTMNFSSSSFKIKKIEQNTKMDFCSSACLHEWIDKMVQEQ